MWDKEHHHIELVVILQATAAPISQLQLIQNLLLTRSLKALDKDLIPIIAGMIQWVDVIAIVQLIIATQMDAGDPQWVATIMHGDGEEGTQVLL